tara:strand:- start:1333 stop:2355 length:1023 start_codon:yes stop_codon:yes gene_type:complete
MQPSLEYTQRLRSVLGNPQLIDFSSLPPNKIFEQLKNTTINTDSVLILNGDVWRYFNIEQNIFNHQSLADKNIYFQTFGYTNAKINDNHYHLSFPFFYANRVRIDKKFLPLGTDLDYGFACLNNRCSIDRFIIGHQLYSNNLLDGILYSQNLFDHVLDRIEQDQNTLGLDQFYEYKSKLPLILAEEQTDEPINFRSYKGRQDWEIPFDMSAYNNAYCFIAIESEVEDYPYERNINLPIATEKSFKSFQTRQIPFVIGARGHYAFLKGLGFEMMEDLLPAGYDEMPFLQKVDAVVDTVAKGKDFVKDFYFDHIREIKHNYELVNSTKVDDLILSRIKDIIN